MKDMRLINISRGGLGQKISPISLRQQPGSHQPHSHETLKYYYIIFGAKLLFSKNADVNCPTSGQNLYQTCTVLVGALAVRSIYVKKQ